MVSTFLKSMNHSFEAYLNENLIFFSDRHWLHPIFEFEEFLNKNPLKMDDLLVKDKIIGRAAALLLVRLNVGRIEAQTISRLGLDVLEYYSLPYTYQQLVERIGCQTEYLLQSDLDPQKAYQLIKERIKISQKKK